MEKRSSPACNTPEFHDTYYCQQGFIKSSKFNTTKINRSVKQGENHMQEFKTEALLKKKKKKNLVSGL